MSRIRRKSGKPQSKSFCACPRIGRELTCKCGEEDSVFEWSWDPGAMSEAVELSDNNKIVNFHTNYSSGTAVVRGSQPMTDAQYFWEIKMTSPVYGTDMMIGVGSTTMRLDAYRQTFVSMLGRDGDGCGLSYYGRLQQKGKFRPIPGGKFTQGSIVGVHADMWRGIVTFYINRKPIAEKCHGLQRKVVYPMVSSTAARTSMKVIKACSFKTSLQFLCCQALRRMVPCDKDVLATIDMPPGLRAFLANNLSWLFRPNELSGSALRKRRPRHDREEYGTSERIIVTKRRRADFYDDSCSSSSSGSDVDLDDETTLTVTSALAQSLTASTSHNHQQSQQQQQHQNAMARVLLRVPGSRVASLTPNQQSDDAAS